MSNQYMNETVMLFLKPDVKITKTKTKKNKKNLGILLFTVCFV